MHLLNNWLGMVMNHIIRLKVLPIIWWCLPKFCFNQETLPFHLCKTFQLLFTSSVQIFRKFSTLIYWQEHKKHNCHISLILLTANNLTYIENAAYPSSDTYTGKIVVLCNDYQCLINQNEGEGGQGVRGGVQFKVGHWSSKYL